MTPNLEIFLLLIPVDQSFVRKLVDPDSRLKDLPVDPFLQLSQLVLKTGLD